MLIEQEIAARREHAQGAVARIHARPDGSVNGDYQIRSSSNRIYRVAMRGPGLFDNYRSCPDFAVNTLGTCNHIEALLLRLGQRRSRATRNARRTTICSAIQAEVARLGAAAFTKTALDGGRQMGLATAEMLAVLASLSRRDFYKSMSTYADHPARRSACDSL